MGLNVLFEVVQNRLPATALLLDGMRRLSVKRFPHRDTILASNELDNELPVSKSALDQVVVNDPGICAGEIEAHAAVLGFHT